MAVIDSGVNYRHEELRGKTILVRGSNMAAQSCSSGPCTNDPWDDGHGTFVAGIVAARRNNARGIAGVAPDARILPIKVDDSTDIEMAIRFAVDHGAKVINVSLATTSTHLDSGVNYAWRRGALLVGGAGNHALPDCGYPAISEHALCVGALARDGTRASYSNWGADVDIWAPGGEVSSPCEPGETTIISTMRLLVIRADPIVAPVPCETGLPDGYTTWYGTSFATPMVSGVAALLFARGFTNREVRDRIVRFADDLGLPGRDAIYGFGRVNALRALRGY